MRRRLPLLVLLYATLDFANPLMPGAVRFEGGTVEVVPGGQSARMDASVTPAPETRSVVALLAADRRVRPTPMGAMSTRSPRRMARCVMPPRRSDRPSRTTEDH
jgi:hypothetical protein